MASRHITKAKTHHFKNDDVRQVLETGDNTIASKTKVVITIGPSCQNVEELSELLEAGATCARIDLTWAPIEYHRQSLIYLQEAMRRTRRLCAVMLDSLGRDIMVKRKYGVDENGWPGIFEQLRIENGQKITITTDLDAECTNTCFPVTYAKFPAMCQPGDSMFIGRYLVTGADSSSLFLEVEDVTATEVLCVARNNAILDGLLNVFHLERSSEGLSNLQNDLPALTDFDREAIEALSKEFEIDFVSLSFCRSVEDITEAREFLSSIGANDTRIIAKCETRQSLMNFRSVAAASDGIIISRGNLGLDVHPEKVAMVQKAMCTACSVLGKPVLITRVCDTMIQTPRPTRAEATDIANAVLDGVDGILLGAETYRGKYGIDTVRTVVAICREAEAVFDHENHFEHLLVEGEYARLALAEDESMADGQPFGSLNRTYSQSSFMSEANIGYAFSSANLNSLTRGGTAEGKLTEIAKLESIAAAAVKTADKVGAAMILVITYSGRTASLIAKYRPLQPIMTLVVPYLRREGLSWVLEGRATARQALLTYGLMPVLAAPAPSAGEGLIEEAVLMASQNGIVGPKDHVVVVSRNRKDEMMIKVLTVDASGTGIENIRPKSLIDMLKATGISCEQIQYEHLSDGEESVDGAEVVRRRLSRTSVLVGSKHDPLVVAPEDLETVDEE